MKTSVVTSFSATLVTLLTRFIAPVVGVSAASSAPTSPSSSFAPTQAFKNTNLVHVISLEKNYVKESVNVVVENIDSVDHDEYYLPFPTEQMSRIGALEARDRIDNNLGLFEIEVVEPQPTSDTQYYRIRLPIPLKPGSRQTLTITYYVLKAYSPLPAQVQQDEAQFLTYAFSAYCLSAYATLKQKTEVKFLSAKIADYTILSDDGDAHKIPEKQGSKLIYGLFDDEIAAGETRPVTVHYEFSKPVIHVARLERDIEVSHWGGNVAFEERYTLLHRGANLSTLFNRVKWAQQQYSQAQGSHALRELKYPLRVGSTDAYFTDAIGNVSTSRFRSNRREALLELRPRYPLFGGWKYPFTIGWNADSPRFLRRTATGEYVVNVPFMEGPRQLEGVEYGEVQVRVILPEGASNVKYHTTMPITSLVEARIGLHKTFLDTKGRTVLVIQAGNLVDEFRDRDLVVSYDYPISASLWKPLVIFMALMGVFAAAYVVGNLELKFSSPSAPSSGAAK